VKLAVPKIRLAASVGVYLTESSVAWCVLDKLPLHTRQSDVGEEPCTKQDWAVALNRVLEKVKSSIGPTASVVIGLPASQTFFATLPTSGNKGENAEVLLTNNHCCTSIPANELSADMLPVKVNGKTLAAIGACRKKDLQVLIDVPAKLGFRFVRVEPAPWALLRTCAPIKGNRVALRLLIEGNNLIAALVCGQQPLLWRTMELADEDAWELVVSMVRTFETYASQHLGVASLDAIVLEGPSTPDIKVLASKLAGDLGERFSSVEGPGPTAASVARGLAMGGLDRDKPAPDLARPLAPPPQLWDLVPRGEVAVLGAVVVCMGLWLWGSGTVALNNALRVEEDNAKNAVLHGDDDTKLKEEKKTLAAEVQAVNAFLSNRVVWTEYLNQLSGRVPPGVQFVTFQGDYELITGSEKNEKKAKKQLLLNFSAMVPRDKPTPREVDELLEKVKTAPAIVRDFPNITLSQLRVTKNLDTGKKTILGDPATFIITCLPKGKDTAKGGGGGGGGGKNASAAAGGHDKLAKSE
jgi:hypothetical protein